MISPHLNSRINFVLIIVKPIKTPTFKLFKKIKTEKCYSVKTLRRIFFFFTELLLTLMFGLNLNVRFFKANNIKNVKLKKITFLGDTNVGLPGLNNGIIASLIQFKS